MVFSKKIFLAEIRGPSIQCRQKHPLVLDVGVTVIPLPLSLYHNEPPLSSKIDPHDKKILSRVNQPSLFYLLSRVFFYARSVPSYLVGIVILRCMQESCHKVCQAKKRCRHKTYTLSFFLPVRYQPKMSSESGVILDTVT